MIRQRIFDVWRDFRQRTSNTRYVVITTTPYDKNPYDKIRKIFYRKGRYFVSGTCDGIFSFFDSDFYIEIKDEGEAKCSFYNSKMFKWKPYIPYQTVIDGIPNKKPPFPKYTKEVS